MMVKALGLVITLSLTIVLLAPRHAGAQVAKPTPHLGVLGTDSEAAPDFRQAMRELGYVEGQNIAIEYRWAAGKVERLPEFAEELVQLHPDLIVTMTHRVALIAKQATTTIPIVFTRVNDPVGVGLVRSLARPGGNITGVSLQGLDLIGKRLQLLHDAVPKLSRIAYLTDPTEPYSPAYSRQVTATAEQLGLKKVLFVEARTAPEVEAALEKLHRERPQALLVEPNTVALRSRKRIAEFALAERLPTMYAEQRFMDAHGFLSYGPSLPDHYRQAAVYVDKILKGVRPADLPVAQPTKFHFVINQKTARGLGLTIPPLLLAQADEVIE